jgi:hypothetical protein
MKWPRLTRWFAAFGIALFGIVSIQAADAPRKRSPIEGTWQWDFIMPDGAQVTPRLRFRVKDGELTGTSRFRRGSETPVKNLSVIGSVVSFDVIREREDGEEIVTHYQGRLSGDTIKGKITSKAGGGEQAHDWVAGRVDPLEGAWTMSTDIGRDQPLEGKLTLQQDGEKLSGKISAFRRELDIQKGKFKDGKISFETSRRSRDGERSTARYHGRLVGDKLAGKVEMDNLRTGNRETNVWEAVRAD